MLPLTIENVLGNDIVIRKHTRRRQQNMYLVIYEINNNNIDRYKSLVDINKTININATKNIFKKDK